MKILPKKVVRSISLRGTTQCRCQLTACFLRTLTHAAMAFCKYSTLVGGNCGPSSENPANVECITIGQCTKEVKGHLTFCKVSDDAGVDSESKLLLDRAGRVFCILGLTKYDHHIDPKRHRNLDTWVAFTYSVIFC